VPAVRSHPNLQIEVYSLEDTMKVLAISRAKLYREIEEGRLKPFKRGRLTYVLRRVIDAYLDLVMAESYDAQGRFKRDRGLVGKGRGRRSKPTAE
jgi:hypothetical protein